MQISKVGGNLLVKPKHQSIGKSFGDVMQQKTKEEPLKTAFEHFRQEITSNHQDFRNLVEKVVDQKRHYQSHELLRFQLLTGTYAVKQQTYFKSLELGTNGIKSLLNMPV